MRKKIHESYLRFSSNQKAVVKGLFLLLVMAAVSVPFTYAQTILNYSWGYSAGGYGYGYGYSDSIPSAPTSLSCSGTTGVCSWSAPSTTIVGSNISDGGGSIGSYIVNYSTSALTTCSGENQLTSVTTSKSLENLVNSTTYYVAVCAVDGLGNIGVAGTTSFVTAGGSAGSSGGGGGSVSSAPTTTPASPTTSSPSTAPTVADISKITEEAKVVTNVDGLLRSIGVTARNNASEKSYEARIKTVLGKVGDAATTQMLVNFVTYGTSSTQVLGAGERLGVLNSYRAAYGKVPSTEAEIADVIKIANGRWPSETNAKAEARAKATFKSIYKREANMSQANDNAAVTVMAYGLRPANRNLNSEKQAIKNFRGTLGRSPSLATDWDMVRAIAYSGAKR